MIRMSGTRATGQEPESLHGGFWFNQMDLFGALQPKNGENLGEKTLQRIESLVEIH